MTSRARWFVAMAALLLASAYVLPLWRVNLIAPQYPEGLGMLIRVNGVEGIKPQDLNSINNLNHYIGMKHIEPESIPELRYMPWLLGGLVVGGALVAALGKRLPLNIWAAALGLLLVAGLYDYWRWGYDYGHDLDQETAIIRIPGMTYQPPLIGSKKLLNFRATSWPASGGIALTLAAGLVAAAVLDSRRRGVSNKVAATRGKSGTEGSTAAVAVATLLWLGGVGCAAQGPRTLVAGQEQCQYCRMEISDPRFGVQVILRTGKIQVFDSIDCAAEFVRGLPADALGSVWVADAKTGNWISAESAGFVRGGAITAPMGNYVAYANPDAARSVAAEGGSALTWTSVLADTASGHGAQ